MYADVLVSTRTGGTSQQHALVAAGMGGVSASRALTADSVHITTRALHKHTPSAQSLLACGVLQSAKLKQAQEQANNLTKEKESLMQVIQELKARIKQGTLLASAEMKAAASMHVVQVSLNPVLCVVAAVLTFTV